MQTGTKRTLFTVGKVFNIIEIVLCFVLFFSIITIPIGVFLIIATLKMDELTALDDKGFEECLRTRKNFGWSIFILVATFPFGLTYFLSYLLEEQTQTSAPRDYVDQLEDLYDQKEKGIITEEEFDMLKKNIIEKNIKKEEDKQ